MGITILDSNSENPPLANTVSSDDHFARMDQVLQGGLKKGELNMIIAEGGTSTGRIDCRLDNRSNVKRPYYCLLKNKTIPTHKFVEVDYSTIEPELPAEYDEDPMFHWK